MDIEQTFFRPASRDLVPQRWSVWVGVGLVAGLAAISMVSPLSDPDSTKSVGSSSSVTMPATRSALLDGEAFGLAASEVVADADRPSIVDRPADFLAAANASAAAADGLPRSALLDGEAFDRAVNAVLALHDGS